MVEGRVNERWQNTMCLDFYPTSFLGVGGWGLGWGVGWGKISIPYRYLGRFRTFATYQNWQHPAFPFVSSSKVLNT